MVLKKEQSIIFPFISTYHVLAINLDTKESKSMFLPAKVPHIPLGEITLDTTALSTIEEFSKQLQTLANNWEIYLLPELVRPYNFTQTLRLNRHIDFDLAPMNPALLHAFIEERKSYFVISLSQEEIINIIKFFNLARSHADFATKLISSRNDEWASQLNISQKALANTFTYLELLGLISIKKNRRPNGLSLPNMIMLSDTFFELAFGVDAEELAQLTDESLKQLNSTEKVTNNQYYNSSLFFTCKSILKRTEELLPKLTPDENQSMSDIAERMADAEYTESSTSELEEARINGTEEELLNLKKDIKELNGYFYQNLESIGKCTAVYTTTDEARSGYEELEIFMLEKKALAKKLYLSGDIEDQRALTSLSYLL